MNTSTYVEKNVRSVLGSMGFRHTLNGFRRNGCAFSVNNAWLTFETACDATIAHALDGQLGWPGLWRHEERAGSTEGRPGARTSLLKAWRFPPQALAGVEASDPEAHDAALRDAFNWATATAYGRAPADWEAPPEEEVTALVPDHALTVRDGPLVSQGSLICEPHRLAFRFPVVRQVPHDLPVTRRDLLDALLRDAQHQWRLVRLGWLDTGNGTDAIAEVDLTGLPPQFSEAMVSISLTALRWVLVWLLRPAALLKDLTVDSQVLKGVQQQKEES